MKRIIDILIAVRTGEAPNRHLVRIFASALALCGSVLLVAPAANAATLTIAIDGPVGSSGTVVDRTLMGAPWPAGSGAIDCGGPPATGQCSASFPQQLVQLVLIATPGPGSTFAGWSGMSGGPVEAEDNCRGLTNPCMVRAYGERTFTATFTGGGPAEEPEAAPELDRYIVVFENWVEDPAALAHEQVEKYGGKLGYIYTAAIKGYSATYPTAVVGEVENEPSVKYVWAEDGKPVPACWSELSSCEEDGADLGPGPGAPDSAPTDKASLGPATGPTDTGGIGLASDQSASAPPATAISGSGICHKRTAPRSRCARRQKRLARRACHRRSGTARRHCLK